MFATTANLFSRFGCQIGEVNDLGNLKHKFPFIKQKSKDSLGMLVHIVPAPPAAKTGWSLGIFNLKEKKGLTKIVCAVT